ncbi:hypothetical protein ACWPKS_04585 [Coraliomargarita sp. W4R72]
MNTSKWIPILCGLTASMLSAAELKIDLSARNSIFLENFNSNEDNATDLRNGVTFASAHDGVGHYRLTKQLDPQILFHHGMTEGDFSSFPNVRLRHAFSEPVKGGSVYPIPSQAGHMGQVLVNHLLTGRQVTLNDYPAVAGGVRIDPVDGVAVAGLYSIDYLILDRGRTLGFEFDEKNSTRGGSNNFFWGYNLGSTNGKEIKAGVDGGLFKGEATTTDPMMVLNLLASTGLSFIDPTVYQFIEIRMRVLQPQNGVATVFFRNELRDTSVHQIDIPLVDDTKFHTYLLDMRKDADWNQDKVTNFRFDPTNKKQGFEIDYIRFYEKADTIE